ncbi:response regulator, partial [bacterium]
MEPQVEKGRPLEVQRVATLERENAELVAQLGERVGALEESEARLRFATEAGRIGVWRFDVSTGELSTSALCRTIFGRDPAKLFSYSELLDTVHPSDRMRMRAAVARSIESGEDYDIEYRILRPSGERAWVLVRAQVQSDEAGRAVSLNGISLDITARKRQDVRTSTLVELDAQLTSLESPHELAAAAVGALVRVLEVTRAGYGTVDAKSDAVVIESEWRAPGVPPLRAVERLRDYGAFADELKRGQPVVISDVEHDPRTKSHVASLARLQIRALMNLPLAEPGGPVALLFLNDVAPREWPAEDLLFIREVAWRTRMALARRRAEAELRRLARDLESKVEERSRTLLQTEAVLRQSQKMEAVGQLTGGIAHDFNNLLAANLGSLEVIRMLLSKGRHDEIGRMVDAAVRSARSAATLTQRLLAFSRQQTLDPRPTDVRRLLWDLEDMLRRTAGPSVELDVAGGDPSWPIRVDRSQLESSVLNLCINARDAMPNGGRLSLETRNRAIDEALAKPLGIAAGDYVELIVSDTGEGMSDDVIAHAFEPFFTTKPIGTGTGLGLSMVYGFAQQSGGAATILSTPGLGTSVSLLLPRLFGAIRGDEEEPEGTAPAPAPEGEGQTVLVVDDEPTLRMLILQVLRESGYQPIEASTGRAAMAMLKSIERIDLLVTDIGLPGGMNGRQLATEARALRRQLPAVHASRQT